MGGDWGDPGDGVARGGGEAEPRPAAGGSIERGAKEEMAADDAYEKEEGWLRAEGQGRGASVGVEKAAAPATVGGAGALGIGRTWGEPTSELTSERPAPGAGTSTRSGPTPPVEPALEYEQQLHEAADEEANPVAAEEANPVAAEEANGVAAEEAAAANEVGVRRAGCGLAAPNGEAEQSATSAAACPPATAVVGVGVTRFFALPLPATPAPPRA